jgi:sulfopyruvate decarboxylase subunit alpha
MARRTVDGLERAAITHVVGIPDNTSGPLFDAVARHPRIRLLTVTREGEAFAVASGLWLGGASPLVVIQNTGLLEAGDAIRGTAQRMGAPIPFIVTGRGYAKMERAEITRSDERTRALLTRADVDSTALLTEPTLDAWGIPFERCDAADDPVERVEDLLVRAARTALPTALVLTRPLD